MLRLPPCRDHWALGRGGVLRGWWRLEGSPASPFRTSLFKLCTGAGAGRSFISRVPTGPKGMATCGVGESPLIPKHHHCQLLTMGLSERGGSWATELGNREHWATRETTQILTTPLLSLCLYHPSNHPSQMLTIHQTHKARYAQKSTYIHRQGCTLKHMHSFVFCCYTACLCESLCFSGHSVYCISRFHKYADDHVHKCTW